MSTKLEEAPANAGSDHDEIVHIVCCGHQLCDGKFDPRPVHHVVTDGECIVCVDLEFADGICRVCGE